jgi:microcystin-dependent protein
MGVNVNGANLGGTQFVPTGSVLAYVGTAAPNGWAFCDGSYLTTADYPQLHSVIGTTYGTTGANFRLPDFRAKFPRGAAAVGTLAGVGGVSTHAHTAGASLANSAGAHTHTVPIPSASTSETGSHYHTDSSSTTSTANAGGSYAGSGGFVQIPTTSHTHTVSVTTNSTGIHSHAINLPDPTATSAGAHTHTTNAVATDSISNLPPYQDINYIIKL